MLQIRKAQVSCGEEKAVFRCQGSEDGWGAQGSAVENMLADFDGVVRAHWDGSWKIPGALPDSPFKNSSSYG